MKFTTLASARIQTGFTYIGNVSTSQKHEKSKLKNFLTYSIFLAPAEMSGYNTCAKSTAECRQFCLNHSGHNKIDKNSKIDNSRIAKTKLFFENREFFMNWVIAEINRYSKYAEKHNMEFCVRLNNTSDLSPLIYKLNGKNILEMFPNVQFYDYTKIANRVKIMEKYANYDVTFSYSGENMEECMEMLNKGVRVAIPFKNKLPQTFNGFPVIDGDKTDLRFLDPMSVIVGLKFKEVRENLKNDVKFVIQ